MTKRGRNNRKFYLKKKNEIIIYIIRLEIIIYIIRLVDKVIILFSFIILHFLS